MALVGKKKMELETTALVGKKEAKLESLKLSCKDRIINIVSIVCRVQFLAQIKRGGSTCVKIDGPIKENGDTKVDGTI